VRNPGKPPSVLDPCRIDSRVRGAVRARANWPCPTGPGRSAAPLTAVMALKVSPRGCRGHLFPSATVDERDHLRPTSTDRNPSREGASCVKFLVTCFPVDPRTPDNGISARRNRPRHRIRLSYGAGSTSEPPSLRGDRGTPHTPSAFELRPRHQAPLPPRRDRRLPEKYDARIVSKRTVIRESSTS
jgi:hypothetical protein